MDQGICDAQTERRGRVSENSLGWGEGAKARDGRARNRHRQRGLVGANGLKPGRQGQGLGLARSEWTAWVVDQANSKVGQNWCAEGADHPGAKAS